jgi:hypothetical protein
VAAECHFAEPYATPLKCLQNQKQSIEHNRLKTLSVVGILKFPFS